MNKKVILGLTLVGIFVLISVFGPTFVPYSPSAVSGIPLESASPTHLMGTDYLGRDILSQFLTGGGGILGISLAGSILGVLFGLVAGLVLGYGKGLINEILLRILDLLLSFPILLTGLLIVNALGNSPIWLIFSIGFIFMPRSAKVIREAVLNEKVKDYIESARSLGASNLRILVKHIFPNIEHIVVVEATTRFAQSLLLVSALSFLGLGVPLGSSDWGRMIAEGRDYLLFAPWIVLFPSIAICLVVIGVNLIADGLQESNWFWTKSNLR